MNTSFHISLLTLALTASVSATDDPLDTWVAAALDKNPEIEVSRLQWEGAKAKIPQGRALEDPMIGVEFERFDTARFNAYSDIEWMVSQKLPWFGKRATRTAVLSLEAEVVGFRYLEQVRSVGARVKEAAWNVWFASKAVESSRSNLETARQLEQITRTRYETSQASQVDTLRVQLEIAKAANELESMQREYSVALASLNALLRDAPDTSRNVDTMAITEMNLSLDEMLQRARRYCCILISFQRAVEAKTAGVRLAKLESSPEFELFVEARQIKGQGGIQEYDTGVAINVPWIQRAKYQAIVDEAWADVRAAEAEFESEVNKTLFEIKERNARVETSSRLMKLYESTLVPQAQQLLESTRSAYQTGQATILELIEAQRSLREMQLELFRAKAQYGKDQALLEQTIAPWNERDFATGLVTPDMR